MTIRTVRRLAADMLKVGKSRVWMDPGKMEDIESAVTRQDVRRLIKEGTIARRPASVPSRGRKRLLLREKRSGRRRGAGSRKGHKAARMGRTSEWPARVRAMRRALRKLKRTSKVDTKRYRKLYLQIKGGRFASVRELLDQVVPRRRAPAKTGTSRAEEKK